MFDDSKEVAYCAMFLRSQIFLVFSQKKQMPANRNALIRYKTIDQCLQNRYRKWTLEDLIEACSDMLYEYEGIDKGVSRRTVQADIQMMRSDKLGYNAPIIVVERKYYEYEDPDFSITNIPLSDQDLDKLSEAVEFMKQFQGFSHFRDLDGMVQKLEAHIYSQKSQTQPVIDFEKNENLKGLEFLDPLYQAIIHHRILQIEYQSFKARNSSIIEVHPYLLKEFRNRWFLVGRHSKRKVMILALDRMVSIRSTEKTYVKSEDFNPAVYFRHVLGVTVNENDPPQEVQLFVSHYHAPYVLTKPFHHSQQLVSKDHNGVTISLHLQLNFELEKEILGLGDGVRVIFPERLKRKIKSRLANAVDWYDTEINPKKLTRISDRINQHGYVLLNGVFRKKMLSQLKKVLTEKIETDHLSEGMVRLSTHQNPDILQLLMTENLKKILGGFGAVVPGPEIKYWPAISSNPETGWRQGVGDVVTLLLCPGGINRKETKIRLLPGSHRKQLSAEEIETISQNSVPNEPELMENGLLLLHPLILRRISGQVQKRIHLLQLEFMTSKDTNSAKKELT